MDTVWITLTVLNGKEVTPNTSERTFLFGTGGIVSFEENELGLATILKDDKSNTVAVVEETSDTLMEILSKMRGTEGRMSGKQDAKAKSKSKTSRTKAKSKISKSSR